MVGEKRGEEDAGSGGWDSGHRDAFGYNAQVVVDGDWGLIGGADVGLWGDR